MTSSKAGKYPACGISETTPSGYPFGVPVVVVVVIVIEFKITATREDAYIDSLLRLRQRNDNDSV